MTPVRTSAGRSQAAALVTGLLATTCNQADTVPTCCAFRRGDRPQSIDTVSLVTALLPRMSRAVTEHHVDDWRADLPGVTTLFLTVGVLDFGCWSREERFAIRWLVRPWARPATSCPCRWTRRPNAHGYLLHWRPLFEEPNATELDGRGIGGPPPGWPGRLEWAADRWPSFT